MRLMMRTRDPSRCDPGRVLRMFLAAAAVLAGFALGFPAGVWMERNEGQQGGLHPGGQHVSQGDAPLAAEPRPTISQILALYDEELLRLMRARNDDLGLVKEKELVLEMLRRVSPQADSSTYRRLECEIESLRQRMARTDRRLVQLREQRSKLAAIQREAAGRPDESLDQQVEVEARRAVLEHEAGLGPSRFP